MTEPIRKLYIEVSSRCNLNCKMCFRNSWIREKYGDLPEEDFIRLLKDPLFSEVETVFFGGMGEPLIHPALDSMVERAAAAGKNVELITNGTLLNSDRAAALIEAGIHEIWISIDELYEDYGRIQIGSDFDLVCGNLNSFNALRQGTGVRLGMTAVVMRDNIRNLDRIRDFAMAFQADDLNLSHMIPNREEDVPNALWSMCELAVIREANAREGPIWTFENLADHRDIPMFRFSQRYWEELFGSDLNKKEEAELFTWKGKPFLRKMNTCRFIEDRTCFVRWDGDVSPCMGLLHSAETYLGTQKRTVWHYAFGNIHSRSLSEIWTGEEYTAFRQRVREFNFSPCLYCGGCIQLDENRSDCIGSPEPTCGGCLWGQGLIVCP